MYKDVQKSLDDQLNKSLQKINDPFKTKDYYLKKWNYTLDDSKKAIDYWSWEKGNGVVQSPKPVKK